MASKPAKKNVKSVKSNKKAKSAPKKTSGAKKNPSAKKTVAKKKTTTRSSKTKAPAKKADAKKTSTGKTTSKAKTATKTKTAKAPDKKAAAAKRGHEVKLPPKRTSKAKMLSREFLFDLAGSIRQAVLPVLESPKAREVVGISPTGDAIYEMDTVAEKELLAFLKRAKMPVAYYSEESGYTTFTSGTPNHLLVVDPVDGARSANAGFEGCVVSVATTRVIERPCISDVDNGVLMEIVGNRTFYAERGKGARVYVNGSPRRPKLSSNDNLESVSWSMGVPARPAELIFPTAAKLIDLSSLKGGFFASNSPAYSLSRLLTNQLDACVDFANRYYRDMEDIVMDQFINAGRGVVLGICPYDIAAAHLIVREAGCVISDAYGHSLDDVLLLDSSVTNLRSMVAASNKTLHKKLMNFFDTRIRQFELLLERRSRSHK